MIDCRDAGTEGPVTVSVARRIRPGKEAEYEMWVSGITQVSETFPGHLGTSVLRPSAATKGDYVIIYRYDTYANLRRWETSPERQAWLKMLEPIAETEKIKRTTGMEVWFDLPEIPASATPIRWRMALSLFLGVCLVAYPANWFLGPLVAPWPLWARVVLYSSIQVTMLTYVVMPNLTRLLKRWIFRSVKES